MYCPKCKVNNDIIIDSRLRLDDKMVLSVKPILASADRSYVRRRRACMKCGNRWTTHERIIPVKLPVTKDDAGLLLLALEDMKNTLANVEKKLCTWLKPIPLKVKLVEGRKQAKYNL